MAGPGRRKSITDFSVSGVVAAGSAHGVVWLTGVTRLATSAAAPASSPTTTTTSAATSRVPSGLLTLREGIQDVSLIVELDGDEFPALISKLSELMSSKVV